MQRGLYDRIVGVALRDALAETDALTRCQRLDPGDSHTVLAAHLARLLAGVLRRQPARDRLRHQAERVNRLVGVIVAGDPAVDGAANSMPAEIGRAHV